MKVCSRCNNKQDLKEFYKHSAQCRLCRNEIQRNRRRKNKNSITQKYEKTKKGFLMRVYRNMKSRVEGIQWQKCVSHYKQEILPKEEFYTWALNNPDFHDLFKEWEENKYDRKITPSIDRIDPRFGYFLKNMQFVTAGENSRRNNIFTHYGRII
jgi:hypothetical protein